MEGRWLARAITGSVLGLAGSALAQVPLPTIGGPFAPPSCEELVLALRPTSIVASPYTSPTGQAVAFDLELREFTGSPGAGLLLDAITGQPQDPAGAGTVIPLDDTVFEEDDRHELRLRQWDGPEVSAWLACDFWINTENGVPGALELLAPSLGERFPPETSEVTIVFRNASDAEFGQPGASLSIALCATFDRYHEDCDPSPANWPRTPSVADPTLTTEIVLDPQLGFIPPGVHRVVYFRACALDDQDACGPVAASYFWAEDDLCRNVHCDPGIACDPETGECLGHVDPPFDCRVFSGACSGDRRCDAATGLCVPVEEEPRGGGASEGCGCEGGGGPGADQGALFGLLLAGILLALTRGRPRSARGRGRSST